MGQKSHGTDAVAKSSRELRGAMPAATWRPPEGQMVLGARSVRAAALFCPLVEEPERKWTLLRRASLVGQKSHGTNAVAKSSPARYRPCFSRWVTRVDVTPCFSRGDKIPRHQRRRQELARDTESAGPRSRPPIARRAPRQFRWICRAGRARRGSGGFGGMEGGRRGAITRDDARGHGPRKVTRDLRGAMPAAMAPGRANKVRREVSYYEYLSNQRDRTDDSAACGVLSASAGGWPRLEPANDRRQRAVNLQPLRSALGCRTVPSTTSAAASTTAAAPSAAAAGAALVERHVCHAMPRNGALSLAKPVYYY